MKPGEIVEFDYELFVEGHDGLYDTTLRERAEEAGILQTEALYAPIRHVLGSKRLIPGLEEALEAAAPGKSIEVEIPPEKAYGARDPKRIETVPIQEFRKNKIDPSPGLVIRWKNRRGLISHVGGGRVRVDFNPALAGKRLRYKVTVRRVLSDPAEKVLGLLLMNYPSPEEPKVRIEGTGSKKVAVVEPPETARFDPNWISAKLAFLWELREHSDVSAVRFVEEHAVERRPEVAQAKGPPKA